MKTVDIPLADIAEGDDVTLWYGSHGQGGIVIGVDERYIGLRAGTARLELAMPRAGITRVTTEVPFDADECLDYGTECHGPVDYWHSGGLNGRSWPRCTFHGEKRLRDHEDSIERYADSDCVPDWFDPADAGERWEDDY